MWSRRVPTLQRSGAGNVFIKNLHESIDDTAMLDTFSAFGNIISCKVATDEKSVSKGYGFIQFETEVAANNCIAKMNGMMLDGRKVYVGKFIPRHEREKEKVSEETAQRFMNVYIKNFGEDLNDEKLRNLFEKFGKVTSAKVMVDENGKSKGFGFVSFEEPAHAAKAVEHLNGKELNGKPLYVGRAQKKSSRQAELKRTFELLKMESAARYHYHGVNMYVKNLNSGVDNVHLRKDFSSFGNITNAKTGARPKMIDEVPKMNNAVHTSAKKCEEASTNQIKDNVNMRRHGMHDFWSVPNKLNAPVKLMVYSKSSDNTSPVSKRKDVTPYSEENLESAIEVDCFDNGYSSLWGKVSVEEFDFSDDENEDGETIEHFLFKASLVLRKLKYRCESECQTLWDSALLITGRM